MNNNNSEIAPPEWWATDLKSVACFKESLQHSERVHQLPNSVGGREIWSYSTLNQPATGKGTANFNAACGARDLDAYFRRGPGKRSRPHVLVLAGVHGTETEGIAGALSLIRALDQGRTLDGTTPQWLEVLSLIDWTICPLLNPDGRARFAGQGFLGWTPEAMQAINCGTRANGEAYGWPACKAVHPMRGDVGHLGGYFDDGGANMMHDEWSAPFSPLTQPVLKLVASIGPDLVLNLHSSDLETCFFIKTWYVPLPVKTALLQFAERTHANLESAGYPLGPLPIPKTEGLDSWPPIPAFNLDSMLFHSGATLPVTFESPRGLSSGTVPLNYSQLLDIHHRLFQSTIDFVSSWYDGSLPYPLTNNQ